MLSTVLNALHANSLNREKALLLRPLSSHWQQHRNSGLAKRSVQTQLSIMIKKRRDHWARFNDFIYFAQPPIPAPITILEFFLPKDLSPLAPCKLQLDKPSFIPISWKAPPWACGTTYWVSEQSCHWGQGMAQGSPIEKCRTGVLQNNVWLSWGHVGKMITSLCLKRNLCMSPPIMQTRLLKWN